MRSDPNQKLSALNQPMTLRIGWLNAFVLSGEKQAIPVIDSWATCPPL
jgi:hypothetical protein